MDPSSYSRSALQELAKKHDVRANATSAWIISELTKLGVFTNERKTEDGGVIKEGGKRKRRSGMTDAVREMLACPVCLDIMRGHIHQVNSY